MVNEFLSKLGRVVFLDHGYVELVESWGSDERIIESARMSTGKNFNGWGPLCVDCVANTDGKLLDPQPAEHTRCTKCGLGGLMFNGDEKLLRFMFRNGHTSPFEFAGATFEIQAPISTFREWHRHRTQSYSEMSARYAPLPDRNYVPTVDRLFLNSGTRNKQAASAAGSEMLTRENAERWLRLLEESYAKSEEVYQIGLKIGVPKELARMCVPVGRYSRMRASANLLNWIRFLRLRKHSAAQFEIQEPAGIACELLGQVFPRTVDLFREELVERGQA